MENSHGNWLSPPRSRTTAGTAAARIVASMATSPVLSITASKTGPRSLRSPTLARVILAWVGAVTDEPTRPGAVAFRAPAARVPRAGAAT